MALAVRIFLYILWAALATQLSLLEARYITGQDPFSEMGYVENAQSALLAASMILLFWMTRARPAQSALALCGALAVTLLFVRELDQALELFLPHGAWKWIALPLGVALAWQCVRHREAIGGQLRALSSAPAFGVYLAAGSALVFSRMFGSSRFWSVLMEEDYSRIVKNAAQEGLELFALGLIFAATVEWLLWSKPGRGNSWPHSGD